MSFVLHKCFFNYAEQVYDYDKLIKALKENGIKNSNLNKAIELDLKDLNEKSGNLVEDIRTLI